MVFKVQKRTGEIVDFQADKIRKAIFLAAKEVGGQDESVAQSLTKEVMKTLKKEWKDKIPSVEEIQDVVEKTLIESGHAKTAKAYILYRERRTQSREDKAVVVGVEKTISEYLDKLDWRVNANSNQGYSLGGMILNTG